MLDLLLERLPHFKINVEVSSFKRFDELAKNLKKFFHGIKHDLLRPDLQEARNSLVKTKFEYGVNNLNIVYLNPGSLRKNMECLKSVIRGANIDIIGISETWFTEEVDNNSVEIKGFKLIRQDRKSEKRGGGIALYIQKDLKWNSIETIDDGSKFEYMFINIENSENSENSICVGIGYNPPLERNKTEGFLKNLKKFSEDNRHLIFMGDLNLNFLEKDQKSNFFFNHLAADLNLCKVNHIPTNFKPDCRPTLVDLIITKQVDCRRLNETEQFLIDFFTDHAFFYFSYNLTET